jgi:hypothetical protein
MDYANLIGLGIEFLEAFLSKSQNKLPLEVLESVKATIAALKSHQDDELTKAAFEAQRG